MTYATIAERAQRISQRAFLRLLRRGLAYQLEAPTLWDIDFRTAVAQAELEDREMPGAYHRVRFGEPGDLQIDIETTRPELIPACVALIAHPDDERYREVFGREITVPLFGTRVPIRPHPLASPEKGSGIAMCCTFGDVTDVVWWRELRLPVRAVVQPDGRMAPVSFGTAGWESRDAATAATHYSQLQGLPVTRARERIVDILKGTGDMICLASDPKSAQFHSACYHSDMEPFMARGRALRESGVTGAQVDTVRFREVKEGKIVMPKNPSALYQLFGGTFDPVKGEVTGATPLYVVYIPFSTGKSTGLPEKPVGKMPWVMFPGTPKAHIMFTPGM